MHEAEEKKRLRDQKDGKQPADDKGMKDRSLFDRLSKERMLREQQLREADPDYEPLSPTAKPGKKKKKADPTDDNEEAGAKDSIFE